MCLALIPAILIIAAGCSSPDRPGIPPTQTPAATPVWTTPQEPVPATTASTIPGPTDTLPQQWPLSITVEKSGMYSTTVITHFNGGKGLVFVSRMDVRVTHPDGTVLTGGIVKPGMGDTVEIPGTSGTDRVEVTVTMVSGDTYKVIDQQIG